MKQPPIIVAAVAAAIVPICVAASESEAAVIYTQGNLLAPAPTTRFVTMAVDADLHRPPRVLFAWGSAGMSAGPSTRNVDVDSPPDFDSYALIGVDSVGGVFVSFANPAAAIGRPFAALFPGFDESQVADAITNGGPLLTDFVTSLETVPGVATSMGAQCSCTHFSDGAPYGTFIASFNPVPAPGAAIVLMITGSGTMLRRRRPVPVATQRC